MAECQAVNLALCVVAREQAQAVLDKSTARDNKEAAVRARLKAGELGLDIYKMREPLAKAGLVYYDAPGDVEKGEIEGAELLNANSILEWRIAPGRLNAELDRFLREVGGEQRHFLAFALRFGVFLELLAFGR